MQVLAKCLIQSSTLPFYMLGSSSYLAPCAAVMRFWQRLQIKHWVIWSFHIEVFFVFYHFSAAPKLLCVFLFGVRMNFVDLILVLNNESNCCGVWRIQEEPVPVLDHHLYCPFSYRRCSHNDKALLLSDGSLHKAWQHIIWTSYIKCIGVT